MPGAANRAKTRSRIAWGKGMTLLAGRRCLVLEDEVLIAIDIQQVLESAGAAEVVCTSNLAEALRAWHMARFDFAVLDLRLSNAETSMTLAEELDEAGTPFIFLTGAPLDEANTGRFAVPLVEKPYTSPILLEAVAKALAR
jgi:CheY-like chemotaxis protein